MMRRTLAVLAILSVVGCAGTGTPSMSANPGPYDGNYDVALTYTNATGTCVGGDIGATFWVRGGKLGGHANHPLAGTFQVYGAVKPDGSLVDAKAVGSASAEFDGTNDHGTWHSDEGNCGGNFTTTKTG